LMPSPSFLTWSTSSSSPMKMFVQPPPSGTMPSPSSVTWPTSYHHPCTLALPMPVWAANSLFSGFRSLGSSFLARPSPLPVHCVRTLHLTFSVIVDYLGAPNNYTLTSQETCCTNILNAYTTSPVSHLHNQARMKIDWTKRTSNLSTLMSIIHHTWRHFSPWSLRDDNLHRTS
jgi:hypothetical protein